MSRSYRKTSIIGISSTSDKQNKRKANRKDRRLNKEILQATQDETALCPKREVSDVWSMNKECKWWFDPDKYPKLLRK